MEFSKIDQRAKAELGGVGEGLLAPKMWSKTWLAVWVEVEATGTSSTLPVSLMRYSWGWLVTRGIRKNKTKKTKMSRGEMTLRFTNVSIV